MALLRLEMPAVERDLQPINGSAVWKQPVGYATPFALFCPQIAADSVVSVAVTAASLLRKEFITTYLLALAAADFAEPWQKVGGTPGERLISCWCGALPATRRSARHLLLCEHLRPVSGHRPFRVLPEASHQIWLFYQPRRDLSRLNLLFRCQAALLVPGREEDWPARAGVEFLARLLSEQKDVRKLIRFDATDHGGFWAEALYYYFVQLRRDYGG